eukprot:scaffold185229_cov14-Prasinocladus_malaysianus.AAC.1
MSQPCSSLPRHWRNASQTRWLDITGIAGGLPAAERAGHASEVPIQLTPCAIIRQSLEIVKARRPCMQLQATRPRKCVWTSEGL